MSRLVPSTAGRSSGSAFFFFGLLGDELVRNEPLPRRGQPHLRGLAAAAALRIRGDLLRGDLLRGDFRAEKPPQPFFRLLGERRGVGGFGGLYGRPVS